MRCRIKAGAKSRTVCHAEAAMVTAGCWSAIVLGTAGVITGGRSEKLVLLPNLPEGGLEVGSDHSKVTAWAADHAVNNTGAKLVIVETAEEAERAINDKTAMTWFS